MMVTSKKLQNIDEYIAQFSEDIKGKLEHVRLLIRESAPKAEEVISYSMPAFKYKKVLVYFAVNKHHIGFYPTAKPIEVFQDRLTDYKCSKGAIRFPLNQSIPDELIRDIVKFRLEEVSG